MAALDDSASRWDQANVHAFSGTYGDYVLNKVRRGVKMVGVAVVAVIYFFVCFCLFNTCCLFSCLFYVCFVVYVVLVLIYCRRWCLVGFKSIPSTHGVCVGQVMEGRQSKLF